MTDLTTVIAGEIIMFGNASYASCTTVLGVHFPSRSFRCCVGVCARATSSLRLFERRIQRGEVLNTLLEGWSPSAHANLTNQFCINSLVTLFNLIPKSLD